MKIKKLTIITASYLICSLLFSCSLFFYQPLVSQGASSYDVYIVKAITDNRILPTTYPISSIGTDINITAAPGEYEPASFVVHATQAITKMQASPTALASGSNTIPASAIDIRYVKAWWVAGTDIYIDSAHYYGVSTLAPELLLKDPGLVKVDNKANYLRDSGGTTYTNISDLTTDLSNIQPQDAATLQPVDISINQNQQYWVTVQVPTGTPAGTYQGTITLSTTGVSSTAIPINITVLPFALEKSNLIYSIYDAGYIGTAHIDYGQYSVTQYTNRLKDMKAHGVDYPQFFVWPPTNDAMLKQELKIREQIGFPMNGPIFNQDMANPSPSDVVHRISTIKSEGYGFNEFFFYGLDEANDSAESGHLLTSQRPAWTAVRNAGGKTYVATCDYCSRNPGWTVTPSDYDTFGKMGDILDVAVEYGPPQQSIANDYHNKYGHKVYNYSNPQTGEEKPETYRRNYGLVLWKAGYDGAMDCAYQNSSGASMWNDFDFAANPDYYLNFRDEVMALNTVDGVVDTIEWEGFREGVDDTRYLATLQKAIANSTNTSLKNEAQTWLNNLNTSNDLYTTRATMIDYTTRLTNPVPTYKTEDVNQDGAVNIQDLQAAANQILGTQSWSRADVNADGKFDVKDLQKIANVILGV